MKPPASQLSHMQVSAFCDAVLHSATCTCGGGGDKLRQVAAQTPSANVQPSRLAVLRSVLRAPHAPMSATVLHSAARTGSHQLPRHNRRLHRAGINEESGQLLASGSARFGGLYVRSRHGATYT